MNDGARYRVWAAPVSTQLRMSAAFPALSPDSMPYIEPPVLVTTTRRELALPAVTARIAPVYDERSTPADGLLPP